ncbi:ATP-binding cassette domain-containing protein [Xenorhabdus sp. Reich]|uniref:ATP-binding cassette domain-containing protein n=1 Tax=Xenorhabdus littoralis TaxID=2582835 RepID=A0ABU4SGG1_9GAMM|nr:ATP-binding cassette domain-containing protein [Xenorhabdus sp. Reich]MDX7997728.1 ATP-binding cassette domain-containing protein [Xenorhabdus sp. Reich]
MLKVIELEAIVGDRKILSNVNCQFNIGLNRIIGSNGTGKTTFLSCLSGLKKMNKGKINFIKENKCQKFNLQKQGFYLSDSVDFYHFLTGLDIINLTKRYKKLNQHCHLDDYLSGFGISSYLNIKFGDMSLGTKRKLLLTSALMTDVDVYIFDEPTNGLDLKSIDFFKELINIFSDEKIIILSSHDEKFTQGLTINDYKIHNNQIVNTGL